MLHGSTSRSLRLPLLLLMGALIGCSDDSPTSPTPPVETTTEVFTGTIDVGETRFHTFPVVASGSAAATLASVTTADGAVLFSPLTLGLGTLSDTTCSVSSSISARPSLTSQLTISVTAGTSCVNLADGGTISGPVKYTIRVVHP